MITGLVRKNLIKIVEPKFRLLMVVLIVVSALSLQVQQVNADDYIVEFQEGLNSYSGTLDTYIDEFEPDTNHGSANTIVQDGFPGDERRSLVLFDLSSIPAGATITSADLQFNILEEGQGFNMHRMLVPWDEAVTYASIGNRHFAPNGVDAEATVVAS